MPRRWRRSTASTDDGALSPNAAIAAQQQGAPGPQLLSDDRQVAYIYLTFNFGENGWNDIPDAVDEIREIADIDGVTVHMAGFGGQAADSAEAFEGIDTNLILITLLVVIVILLITYRSPILWLLPIISAVVAYSVSGGVVYLLAKYADLTVNGQSQAIMGILVIGAGTDYALLLTARYREELRRHEDRHEAMAFALHRAAPAILASAATVAAGMLCLVIADLNSTAGLGPVNAVAVAVTYLVMVTLLPALLVIFGRWMFWPKRPGFGTAEPTSTGFWAKVGNAMQPRPRKVWMVTTGLLLLACLGLFKLDPSGLSTEEQYTKEFDSIKGQTLLVEHGLEDNSNTIQVVTNTDALSDVEAALGEVDGLGEPTPAQDIGNGRSYFEATIGADVSSTAAFDIVENSRDAVHDVEWCRRVGRRRLGVLAGHQDRLRARQQGDHPGGPGGRVPDPDAAAAGIDLAAAPDGHGGAVLRRRARAYRHCCSPRCSPERRSSRSTRASRIPTRASRCSRSCSWSPSGSTTTSS